MKLPRESGDNDDSHCIFHRNRPGHYAIKTDEVFDTHSHENAISHSPREVELG
jgi:hypothetical protein